MSIHYQRGSLLLQQNRPSDAEMSLRQHLAQHPNDAVGHAMLALALNEQEKNAAALDEARQAVHLAPDDAYAHYVLAITLTAAEQIAPAIESIEEALRLDPASPEYFALLAHLRISRKQWKLALEAAEQGLALDAEHEGCTNTRAIALVNLGRKSEAGQTIDAALARDPHNSVTHANMGWTLLHQGDHRRAAEHFREALRIDPTNDWARQGIVEALKARNPIYRWLLAYFLWAGRLSARAQMLLLVGIVFGVHIVDSVTRGNPSLILAGDILLLAYNLFVMLVWCADPLFNLILRLDSFGRHALSDEQRRMSSFFLLGIVATCPLVAFGALLIGFDGARLFIPLLLPLAIATQVRRRRRYLLPAAIALFAFAFAYTGVVLCYFEDYQSLGIAMILRTPLLCALTTWIGVGLAVRDR